jgi:hypothetical protein
MRAANPVRHSDESAMDNHLSFSNLETTSTLNKKGRRIAAK